MRHFAQLLLIAFFAIACHSDGNGGGAPGYTHNQLADKFVRELNLDPDFSVTLMKSSTLQDDYIVIYDPYTNTYDAIDIRSYDPRLDNAADYYFDTAYNHFYGLYRVEGHYETYWEVDAWGNLYLEQRYIPTRYHDPYSSIVFEKTEGTPKDLAKVSAMVQAAKIEKTAKHLSLTLGLSHNRALEVSRLNANWSKTSLKSMSVKELDNYSSELLGFSISEAKTALEASAEGDSTTLQGLVDKAAETNNISPEHASKLMSKAFGL